MKLKRSFYNVEVDKLDNGDILLSNTYTTAFSIMNKETQDIYYNIENVEESKITDDKIKSNIDIMKQNGFLVDRNINEYERIRVIKRLIRYNSNNLDLTIAPTLNCNMNCPYCYEEKNNTRMT